MKRKILLLILCGVMLVAITGCGKNKSVKEPRDWKDRYFNYLSYMIEHNPIKIHKVGFIKSKVSDIPIMYVQEESTNVEENNKSLSYYWIKDDKVEFIHGMSGNNYSKVKYLYNVEKQKYEYYDISRMTEDGLLYELLERLIQSWTEYEKKEDFGIAAFDVLDNGTIRAQYNVSGGESTELKNVKKHIDDVLIDAGIEEDMFEFENDNNKFRDNIDKLKTEKELVTEEVKNRVEEEINRIKTNPKPINENTQSFSTNSTTTSKNSNGISAGNYTIKYGIYKSNVTEYMGEFGGEYTIKPDGTFSYTNTWKDYDGNTSTNTASGTYEVRYANMKEIEEMPDDYKWVITFTATSYSGKGRFTDPTSPNDKYYNVDSYDITGNNKFQASQYENVWTLVN